MKKLLFLIFLLPVLFLFLSGCGQNTAENSENSAYTAIIDQMGRKVLVPDLPQKIVSLSPSNTEIAFALGLGGRVVGITDHCDYPPETEKIPRIGGFANPNVEEIIALEPDLVLASSLHEKEVKKLETLHVPVIVLSPHSVEDIFEGLTLVGKATGNTKQAQKTISEIKDAFQRVEKKIAALEESKRVRVYYEVYSEPLMSAGSSSVIHEIISLAGGKNIFSDVHEKYPKVSPEAVINRDPQVIMFPHYHGSEKYMSGLFKERPGWNEISAVKNGKIYGVNDSIFSRPGPRVAEAVEEAAKLLYPDLF